MVLSEQNVASMHLKGGAVMDFNQSVESILNEIQQHKQNCAAQALLEARFRRDGDAISSHLVDRLSMLKEKNTIVENWLFLLSEDEEYVVRRHLIDGMTWSRIETEYAEHWKEFAKTQRTLMRYYRRALEKIQRFIREQ